MTRVRSGRPQPDLEETGIVRVSAPGGTSPSRLARITLALLLAGALSACDGDGVEGSQGQTAPAPPSGLRPGPGEQFWGYPTTLNADAARLTGCTGDLVEFEGARADSILAVGCSYTSIGNFIRVVRSPGAFASFAAGVICTDGTTGGVSRISGTAVGSSLEGTVESTTLTEFGTVETGETSSFTGTESGSTILLEEHAFELHGAGLPNGRCAWSPPLASRVQVISP
jgi:hypothetical protein